MRKLILQMMTTLNGRLDDPMDWVHGVAEDQYTDIDRLYAGYDTVLVGRTTYEEMAAYWPTALAESEGTETNRRMAHKMHEYRKLVFSRSARDAITDWNNTERIVAADDNELAAYLTNLKQKQGADIILSGGSSFARSVIALDLVDEFHFFVYPIVSPGTPWFSPLTESFNLQLVGAKSYSNGVVHVHYAPAKVAENVKRTNFSELL